MAGPLGHQPVPPPPPGSLRRPPHQPHPPPRPAVPPRSVATGEPASGQAPAASATTPGSWFARGGVAAQAPRRDAAGGTLGESITDSLASWVVGTNRWPDFLARRLNAREEI